jgi:chaperonin cofactor prefoldin
MKKFILAFLVIMVAGSCFAASIDVQEAVPADTVWSFSVTMPNAADFDEAKVLLDGTRIASFYTYNDKIKFDEEDIDRRRVFSNTEPIGNTVYFLVSPLGKGRYELVLEVDDESRAEEEIEFFEIYDAEEKADLQTQLNSLRGSVNSLIEQYNEIEAQLGEKLTEADRQQLQSGIDSLQTAITNLEEQETDSGNKISALNQEIQVVNMRVNDLNKSTGFALGFFSLGSIKPETRVAIIFILVLVAAAILIAKFRDKLPLKKGLYGKPKKEEVSFTKKDEDIAEQVMNETQDESQKGKWAFGPGKPAEQERKPFNIGDLIKK